MNITTAQLKALRPLLSKKDKQAIALQSEKSFKTVEAILCGERTNDTVEQCIVQQAKQNYSRLSRIFAAIEIQNLLPTTVDVLISSKNSPSWLNNETYQRYNDIFISLCTNTYDLGELWEILNDRYKDIIIHSEYCCDLLCRLVGIEEKTAVEFYNSKI